VRYFETKLLEDANLFVARLDPKAIEILFGNIRYAERTNNPKLFKKLRDNIWEFRSRYKNQQLRLLAFWDKTDNQRILVVATHGFIKKTDKVPIREIERAINIRKKYFESKKE
jgi:phage-related protein